MEPYFFQVADISFFLKAHWPVPVHENYAPFLTAPDFPADEQFELEIVDQLPAFSSDFLWQRNCCTGEISGQRMILHRIAEERQPYLMELFREDSICHLMYTQSSNEYPRDLSQVFDDIGLENVLLRHNTIILHSSFIRWHGNGILFSAPPGTGKSTQAALWERYMGADTLNGDRAGLRKVADRWTAYGLPYAGSSGIYRNEKAPIRCIVMLEQGPENKISPLTPGQAFRRMYPEVTLHRWDEKFLSKGLNLLTDLLASVPVYLLSCRPDREAVKLLHHTIFHEV